MIFDSWLAGVLVAIGAFALGYARANRNRDELERQRGTLRSHDSSPNADRGRTW